MHLIRSREGNVNFGCFFVKVSVRNSYVPTYYSSSAYSHENLKVDYGPGTHFYVISSCGCAKCRQWERSGDVHR